MDPATTPPGRTSRRKLGYSVSARPAFQRAEDSALSAFSDEYDLAHEDPQILQDVQRALRVKARRDARVKSGKPSSRRDQQTSPSSSAASPNTSPHIGQASQVTFPASVSAPLPRMANQLDFSPATKSPPASLHPVPRSSDDGVTLDWSAHEEDEKYERRWTLSISKTKDKQAGRPFSLPAQEHMFSRHIDTIRAHANTQTLYKAELVTRQLGRRYQFLSNPENNLLAVTRWYSEQDARTKDEIEDTEPFLWLSHHDRKRRKHQPRSPLHLSALILERYIAGDNASGPVQPPLKGKPEPSNLSNTSFTRSNISTPGPHFYSPFASIQSGHTNYLSTPDYGSVSQEDVTSLDPPAWSGRNSFESRRSADSFGLEPPLTRSGVPSPASSKLHIRDFAMSTLRERDAIASVSPRPSVSEDAISARSGRGKKHSRPPEMDLTRSDTESGVRIKISRPPSEDIPASPLRLNTAATEPKRTGIRPPSDLSQARILGRRKRTSLPSSSQPPIDIWERQRQSQADEDKLRQEYDRKSKWLEHLTRENTRTRVVLNHVALAMRDYDASYSKVMRRLGLPHIEFTPDVLEAFLHDPSTVMTSTPRGHGWRLTEDIHAHITRQRDALTSFLADTTKHGGPLHHAVLEDSMQALLYALNELEGKRQSLSTRTLDTSKLLDEVQKMEEEARTVYEKTSTTTSVVYPELTTLATLDESYRDQYQHIWDIGINMATLLFDTVTPFWRSYGRTILDDVIAFLVIPLYRHEFTGEAKRYRITTFPRRSFRHWLGLILFLLCSSGFLLISGRTVWSSLKNYTLSNIDHLGIRYALIPFFWTFILIQCIALLLEAAVVVIQICVWIWWLCWAFRIVS